MRHEARQRALRGLAGCGTVKIVIPLFLFLFGIATGSFLNVCITRIPEDISIVSPGSRCPRCLSPIKPYDNIPVFGWLLLRGKCRNCHLPISPMYPIVEFITGLFFISTFYTFGFSLPMFKFLVFGCLLIILIVTDIRVRLLPDAVNFFGLGLALAFATRVPPDGPAEGWLRTSHLPLMVGGIADAIMGAAFGSFFLWGAAALYKLLRKREGMGMGDVKMMAMVGAFLGVRGAFLTILLGTLLGSVVGIGLITFLFAFGWRREVAKRAYRRGLGSIRGLRWTLATQYQLPLGTFLGIAAFVAVYVYPWILAGRVLPGFGVTR
jgi:leader peptidase (prepilin peptidase) / N-methyltransferase